MKTAWAWKTELVLAALVLFFHSAGDLPGQAAAAVPAKQGTVRVALLGPPSTGASTSAADGALPVVVDLLTARLSGVAGFELIERSALDAILRELALSASNLAKPTDAVQIGRLLKADWLVVFSQPKGMTNVVMAKIFDASSGVIRDLQLVPFQPNAPSSAVEALMAFVVGARNLANAGEARLYIGFGGFEDLGLYQRYRSFGEQLRTAMALKYAGSRTSVVERSQMRPLLEELNLTLGGFTEVKTNQTSAQPAFVLVDGLYQAFRDERSQINLVLRMEWVGGRRGAVTIKELPGAPLETKVMDAIARFLAESPSTAVTNAPTRQTEANAQAARGRDLARIGSGYFVPFDGGTPPMGAPQEREPRMRQAMSAFESAIFLAPDELEAKFGLAGCLIDPAIAQVEKARDIWREIAATSTNGAAITAARSALAASYVKRDDAQAFELLMALRNDTRELASRAHLNGRIRPVLQRLGAAGKLGAAEILEFAVNAWRTDCQSAELRASEGRNIDGYMAFLNPIGDFTHAFSGANSTEARQAYIGGVISNLAQEFPRLEPYLVSSYAGSSAPSPYWRERYQRTLTLCDDKPESIPDVVSYFTVFLSKDLRSFAARGDYEGAERVARVVEKHGPKYLRTQQDKDELDFVIGVVRFKLNRLDEAIAAFERIGPRQVSPGRVAEIFALGNVRFISGNRAAEICREQAGLSGKAAASVAEPVTMLKPVQILTGPEVRFAIDGDQMWLSDRVIFYRYATSSGMLQPIQARVNPRVRKILVHRNRVWFATADGLYGWEPNDGSVVTNTVNNGLLMPGVTALVGDADRIWIGFGGIKEGSNVGGLGYLNLSDNGFVGMMSELPASLATTRPAKREREPGMQSETRRYVIGLAKASETLWVGTTRGLWHDGGKREGTWQMAIPAFPAAMAAGVDANSSYAIVPCYEPNGWSSGDTNFGGLFVYEIQKNVHWRLTHNDGFLNNQLYAAILDGAKAWVGGQGFVALLDLPSRRIEKTFRFPSALPVHSMALAGPNLWFSSGPGLYRLPRHDAPESSPSASVATAPAKVAPEITDIQSARELLKKQEEIYRIYGTRETAEYRELTARYHAFVRKASQDFPLLESPSRSSQGTNHFLELLINKEGRGYGGFRFKNALNEPADLGWILAFEEPSAFRSWMILPVENTLIRGFTDYNRPKIAYTNAPWSGAPSKYSAILQFLHDGQLVPGKEYIIWFSFDNEQPVRFFLAFDLFPGRAQNRSRTVLEGAFGLKGPSIPGAF